MDALTAGSALVISKFSVAVILVGIYCLMPDERCARDWALATILVASGALVVILNAGAPRFAIADVRTHHRRQAACCSP
jgi:hypothetical protein